MKNMFPKAVIAVATFLAPFPIASVALAASTPITQCSFSPTTATVNKGDASSTSWSGTGDVAWVEFLVNGVKATEGILGNFATNSFCLICGHPCFAEPRGRWRWICHQVTVQ